MKDPRAAATRAMFMTISPGRERERYGTLVYYRYSRADFFCMHITLDRRHFTGAGQREHCVHYEPPPTTSLLTRQSS